MPGDPLHAVTVCGVVENDRGDVLLVQVAERGWEMPGGRVEAGEGLIAALEREVAEEAGCTIAVGPLVAVYSRLDPPAMVLHLFRARHVAGVPEPRDPAITEAGWFAIDRARVLVHEVARERLEEAVARREGVAVKAYRASPFEIVTTAG